MEYTKIRSILILSHFETVKEDTFENLRKFLESDDPALIQMGLSMAKGSRVPEELLPTILKLYMWNDEKTIRANAKSVFNNCAPEDLKKIIKNNWKPDYRTLSISGNKFKETIHQFRFAFKSQDDFSIIASEPLNKTLENKLPWSHSKELARQNATIALGKIGGKRAVELLIKTLGDENEYIRSTAASALGEIGGKRAVEPLIKSFEANRTGSSEAAISLGKIGDTRAVGPFIKAIDDWHNRSGFLNAVRALGKMRDVRAVKPLIIVLEDGNIDFRADVAQVLGKIGDKRAVESLIKALEDEYDSTHHPRTQSFYSHIRQNIIEALVKITENHLKGKEKKNIIKFLKSDDQAMVRMGTSMLEGILKE